MTATASERRSVADLRQERDFLLRSIEDLEREHAAGDVDDVDFAAIRAGYVERAAATLREIAAAGAVEPGLAAGPTESPGTGSRASSAVVMSRMRRLRRFFGWRASRRALILLGLVCALALVAFVAARAAGVRLPGESATGSVTLSSAAQVRQELDQASVLAAEGEVTQAISVYDTVLQSVPHQAEALAYKGWFLRLTGIRARSTVTVADGDASILEAVRYAPGYAEARAFDGIALLEDEQDGRGALQQFRAFLADKPSSALLSSVGSLMARAFVAEHAAIPSQLAPFAPKAMTSSS